MVKKKGRGARKKAKKRVLTDAPAEPDARGEESDEDGQEEGEEHDEHEGDGDDGGESAGSESEEAGEEGDVEEEESAPSESPRAARDAEPKRGRGERPVGPAVDPLLPSRDGPSVSSGGGLIFVAIIFGLIIAAIVAQLVMDR
jgi:hypothetical protein